MPHDYVLVWRSPGGRPPCSSPWFPTDASRAAGLQAHRTFARSVRQSPCPLLVAAMSMTEAGGSDDEQRSLCGSETTICTMMGPATIVAGKKAIDCRLCRAKSTGPCPYKVRPPPPKFAASGHGQNMSRRAWRGVGRRRQLGAYV